jgi:hypothetical protein
MSGRSPVERELRQSSTVKGSEPKEKQRERNSQADAGQEVEVKPPEDDRDGASRHPGEDRGLAFSSACRFHNPLPERPNG